MSDPITCSIAMAVEMSGLSRSYLYQLINDRKINTRKLGRRRLVLVDSLRGYLEREAA